MATGRRAYTTTDSTENLDRYGYVPLVDEGNKFVLLRRNGRLGLVGMAVAKSRRGEETISGEVAAETSRWLPPLVESGTIGFSADISTGTEDKPANKLFCKIVSVGAATETIRAFNEKSLAFRKGAPQLALLSAPELYELLATESAHFEALRKWQTEKGFVDGTGAVTMTPEQREESAAYEVANGLSPLFHADARYFARALQCVAVAPVDSTEYSFLVVDKKRMVETTAVDQLRRLV